MKTCTFTSLFKYPLKTDHTLSYLRNYLVCFLKLLLLLMLTTF